MRLTSEGEAMHAELVYGHNPAAYICGERPEGQAFTSDALCVICSDGFEAVGWKRRALRAEAELDALRDTQ